MQIKSLDTKEGVRQMNIICNKCAKGRNCVNGRFCTVMGVYVEHHEEPPCESMRRKEARKG